MFIAGLDVGTSGCKITVYNDKGEHIENHYKAYDSTHSSGIHEIDANEIIKSVKSVIKDVINKPEALGITTFGETFVLLDENNKVLSHAMLYTDPRADISVFNVEETKKIAGCKPHSMYSLPKLVWIRKNNPNLYNKSKRIMLMQDFIGFILTGNAFIDYSLAARTMGFDIRKKIWSKDIFDKAEIDMSKMSTPVPSGTIIGESDEFGLKKCKIIVGCHDQVASAIGAGALENGVAVDGCGTVECITPVFDKLPTDFAVLDKGFAFVPYIDNKYVCYAFSFTGGAALKWFKDNFEEEKQYRELDNLISDSVGDVLVLPHFAGAATPYMDNDSRALFANVTLETSKYDFYKAIMEGVAYEMKINIDALSDYSIIPEKLLATGGGSKSDTWLKIKSNVLNMPIIVVDAPEVGTLGTLILVSTAIGITNDIKCAKELFVKEGKIFYPQKDKNDKYMDKYKKYKKIYNLAKELR